MSKRLCVIQLHYTDFQFAIEKFNPIKKLKDSNIFDEIILICPDMNENKKLENYHNIPKTKLIIPCKIFLECYYWI